MTDDHLHKLIEANAEALRKVAALLEAVATLVEAPHSNETPASKPAAATAQPEAPAAVPVAFDPCAPTRRMPHMEQHALALDDAVRGVAAAVEKLEQNPGAIPQAIPTVWDE